MSSLLEKSKEEELLEKEIRNEYRKLWNILKNLSCLYKQYDLFRTRNKKNNCVMNPNKLKETRCEDCEY